MKKIFFLVATFFVALTASATSAKQVYLELSTDWAGWPAKYAVYYFKSASTSENGWSEFMELVENETIVYTTSIPSDYDQVIFARFNSSAEAPAWDSNKWSQTVDLTLPTNDNDMFTVTSGGTGDKCNGEWSKYEYEGPTKFYIAGSMTNWGEDKIKVTEDSYTFENLAAGYYQIKVITAENQWIGYNELTVANKALYQIQTSDNNICFNLNDAGNVTVTYIKDEVLKVEGDLDLPDVSLIGINGWTAPDDAIELIPAADSLTASIKLNLSESKEFKIIVGTAWIGKEANPIYELKRGSAESVDGLTYAGDNIKLIVDLADKDYTLTWNYATATMTASFPEPRLVNGYYLYGTFNGVDKKDVASMTANDMFVWNKTVYEGNEEFKVMADLVVGDEFKAVYVYLDQITEYIPAGTGNDYKVDANHAANGKTIYFQQQYNSEWGGHFWVDANDPTAVENAEAEVKAVKSIENGQIVIIKNGVKYNVVGAVVK